MAGPTKIAASVLSATMENTLALANLKFDFSLMKVDAPVEYKGMGEALSNRRRFDAEDGNHHKTARRLAALFEQLIPSTPKLVTAYGLRSSEIIQTPGVNPRGSPKHGPFEPFVGADGTAMWAAATSGIPALGVYLLACMLARAWDAKEAISIWVELVNQRKQQIVDESERNCAISDSSRISIHQEILRDDLAKWDASARAWLRSADQAKVKERTQLSLLIKNAGLPFQGGATTYLNVVEAWRGTMSCLERLLNGQAQAISDGSMLLAFSAWHIYPNLIWLGSEIKNIEFNDPCVDPKGVGTITLEPRPCTTAQGASWSLALSHYRYYGDPITVQSTGDFSRVTIQQLHIIGLGSILKAWQTSKRDFLTVAHWFSSLWDFLVHEGSNGALDGLGWFKFLAQAAKEVLRSSSRNESSAFQLLTYGERRGKQLLGLPTESVKPYFGLANEGILAGLSEKLDDERGIAYLRAVARMSGWRSSQAYITRVSNVVADGQSDIVNVREFITAVPHSRRSRKRDADGKFIKEVAHARWLFVEGTLASTQEPRLKRAVDDRLQQISARGEDGSLLSHIPVRTKSGDWTWTHPPFLFSQKQQLDQKSAAFSETDTFTCSSILDDLKPCKCFCQTITESHTPNPVYESVDQIGSCRLFWERKSMYGIMTHDHKYLDPPQSIKLLSGSSIQADAISTYLQYQANPAPGSNHDALHSSTHNMLSKRPCNGPNNTSSHNVDSVPIHFNYIKEFASKYPMSDKRSRALLAFELSSQFYLQLIGATISLKVVETPLDEAPWFPEGMPRNETMARRGAEFCSIMPPTLPRANALSCIAHFESGSVILDPEEFDQTLAIASENSIFVIGALMSDPYDTIPPSQIKRIVGNIGRTGICLLVAPIDPKIRPLSNQYNLVNHATYDGKREDNFKSTSLHLSFTDWTLPLEGKGAGDRTIDQEVYLVESVISVMDSGKWVADLDVLCIDFESMTRMTTPQQCPGHPTLQDYDCTSLDSWEEFLDKPSSIGFFRAHGNWAARLAALSIMCQQGESHCVGILGPEKFCFECLNQAFDGVGHGLLRKFESPLPSICID